MPPAHFIAESTGASTGGALHQSFATPAARQAGDTYIAVLVTSPGTAHLDASNALNAGWEELYELELGNATVVCARRTATEADPATLDVVLTGSGGATWVLSALIVERDLDPSKPLVDAAGTNIAASTNFVCPGITLATYSDLYIGIVGVTSAAVAVTPPAGASEKHEHALSTRELEIFTFHAEATGATGTKTATTGANQSGVAVAIALAAMPLLGAGKAFALDPIGTIGLPVEGV